jgi:hypothetical protein
MWYRGLPPVCARCAALGRRPGGAGASLDLVPGAPPHDELDRLAEAGHIEWGNTLYRCRACGTYWELEEWTYFPGRANLRRVAPVASMAKWTARQRRRMEPRSLFVAGALVLGAGILLLAAFAGIWWMTEVLFSRAAAEAVSFSLVLLLLLVLYREQQYQDALRTFRGAGRAGDGFSSSECPGRRFDDA